VTRRVRVIAPATTANLGPGFDCLGAALSFRLELEATESSTTTIEVAGEGEGEIDDSADNLVLRAVAAVMGEVPPMRLRIGNEIPLSRGLGSSAAAVAGGLLLGCALSGTKPAPARMLELGLPLEGHPDNLAACLHGGLVLVLPDRQVLRFEPTSAVSPMVLIPSQRLGTSSARAVLPDGVPFQDAVATSSRTAGLLSILTGAAPATREALLECTKDVLHQPYRASLMPETASALESLRAAGVPAVVSGAGPSILYLLTGGVHTGAPELEGWTKGSVGWDSRGARVEVEE
jgi:homoserine kinase